NAGYNVLLNKTAPGTATARFAPQTFATGQPLNSIAVADLDGDGRPELIANNGLGLTLGLSNLPRISIAPVFAAQQTFATGTGSRAAAVADVNRDGRPDLLVANASNSVSVLLNTSSPEAAPSFAAQQQFTTGNNPVSVAAADVNGDGRPDVIAANNGS